MKTFNKSLLAAAVIGAIALPGVSSAASLTYTGVKQITYATDLIASNGIPLHTHNNLRFAGTGPASGTDGVNLASVTGTGVVLKVRVALTGGAKFDTTVAAPAVAGAFLEGTQLGGTGVPVGGLSGAQYTAGNTVLEFTFTSAGTGDVTGDFALELPSFKIVELVSPLGSNGNVNVNITLNHNASGQLILSGAATVAQTVWGETVTAPTVVSADTDKLIDVGISGGSIRRTYFSPDGAVGNSNPSTPPGEDLYFNANGFNLAITQAARTDGTLGFVNDFDATLANPAYFIAATGNIFVTITGTNLGPWQGTGRIWLDRTTTCTHAATTSANLTVASSTSSTATGTVSSGSAMFAGVNSTPPSAAGVNVYVCFQNTASMPSPANTVAMLPQALSGTLTINHGLPALRQNPPTFNFPLYPLRENGTTFTFQNVNPGGNATAQSFLRLSNHNGFACPVRIEAKDDLGRMSGIVDTNVAAHASEHFNSDILESGVDSRLTGSFGDGAGKWFVRITSECANFTASALNRNASTGVVTDLTPERRNNSQWSDSGVPVP